MRRLTKSYRKASNSSFYGSRCKLDFVLMKENISQAYHRCLFGMNQSKVSECSIYDFPVCEIDENGSISVSFFHVRRALQQSLTPDIFGYTWLVTILAPLFLEE